MLYRYDDMSELYQTGEMDIKSSRRVQHLKGRALLSHGTIPQSHVTSTSPTLHLHACILSRPSAASSITFDILNKLIYNP